MIFVSLGFWAFLAVLMTISLTESLNYFSELSLGIAGFVCLVGLGLWMTCPKGKNSVTKKYFCQRSSGGYSHRNCSSICKYGIANHRRPCIGFPSYFLDDNGCIMDCSRSRGADGCCWTDDAWRIFSWNVFFDCSICCARIRHLHWLSNMLDCICLSPSLPAYSWLSSK